MTPGIALAPLSRALRERAEIPSAEAVLSGEIPIVAKIRFSDGGIELRASPESRTDLVLARTGDLLVSGINALKGAIGLLPKDAPNDVAATIHYAAYVIDEAEAVPEFIHEFLRSNAFRRRAVSQLPNGIKTELKARRLLAVQVPIPLLAEQRRIVERLRATRQLIAGLLKRRNRASQMILGRRVTIGADVRRVLAARLGEMEQRVAAFTRIGVLSDTLIEKLRHGPSFPCADDADGVPVLMPSSTTGFGLDTTRVLFAVGEPRISGLDFLEPGDIIFARGNKPDQVGTCGLYEGEPGCTTYANLFMRIRIGRNRFEPRFAQYWLMTPSVREHVRQHTKGTGPSIQKINGQGVRSIPFPTEVPRDEQRWWIRHLDALRVLTVRLAALEARQASDLATLQTKLIDDTFESLAR